MSTSYSNSRLQALISGFANIISHLFCFGYTTYMIIARNAYPSGADWKTRVFILIWCVVAVLLSAVMIYGILKKRYNLLFPYIFLGVCATFLTILIGFFILMFIFVFYGASIRHLRQLVIPAAVIIAFEILMWLPAYCLYHGIKTGRIIQNNDISTPIVAA